MTKKKKRILGILLVLAVVCAVLAAITPDPGTEILPRGMRIASAVCVFYDGESEDDLPAEMAIPAEAGEILADAVRAHRSAPFPVGADDPDLLSHCVTIRAADGTFCTIHYQYYSGFSFPRGREDDYRTVVTRFDADGKARKAWKMADDFDRAFEDWWKQWARPSVPDSFTEGLHLSVTSAASDDAEFRLENHTDHTVEIGGWNRVMRLDGTEWTTAVDRSVEPFPPDGKPIEPGDTVYGTAAWVREDIKLPPGHYRYQLEVFLRDPETGEEIPVILEAEFDVAS